MQCNYKYISLVDDHELFCEPPCILLDIRHVLVLDCPRYTLTQMGMYYQSIEENAGPRGSEKKLFLKDFW